MRKVLCNMLALCCLVGMLTIAGTPAHAAGQPQVPQTPQTTPTTVLSHNWGGFIEDTATSSWPIREVWGDFNVAWENDPSIRMKTWVGIGGFEGDNLIQAGVDQLHDVAFFQTTSQGLVQVFAVHPGDEMGVDIQYDSSQGVSWIWLGDFTTNTYFSKSVRFSADLSTAEWIEEQETIHGIAANLPYVGNVAFSSCGWVTADGTYHNNLTDSSALTFEVILDHPDLDGHVGSLFPGNIQGNNDFTITPVYDSGY